MNRIRELREKQNISMKDTAAKLQIPYTTYINYEKGYRDPNSEMLIKIANLYGVTVDYLIGKDKEVFSYNQNEPSQKTEKNPANQEVDEAGLNEELISRLCQLTPEDLDKVDAFVQGLLASR